MRGDETAIVSGVGRCGTSMVMAMLGAGGMEVVGEPPLYQDPWSAEELARDLNGFRGSLQGHVVKLLYPRLWVLDEKAPYRCIWLVRDPMQQAASQAKLHFHATGEETSAARLRQLTKDNIRLSVQGLCHLREDFGDGTTVYARRFEWCLNQPHALAMDLAKFLDEDLDTGKMERVVRKRLPECSPFVEWEKTEPVAIGGSDGRDQPTRNT